MEIMFLKANDDYWVRFKNIDTLEDLFKIRDEVHHNLIIEKNFNYNDDPKEIFNSWEKINFNTAIKISQSKYCITIYNSYIE